MARVFGGPVCRPAQEARGAGFARIQLAGLATGPVWRPRGLLDGLPGW
jgi:hypothetical protein